MYKIIVDGKAAYDISMSNKEQQLNGVEFNWDVITIKKNVLHIIKDNRSYEAEVINHDVTTKSFTIRVNGNDYNVQVKDKYDLLLERLGMSVLAGHRVNEIKAPMPGLVLGIQVKVGQEITKDTPVLILEAMKMENVLKSPGEGIVKKLEVKEGQAVEKNQVLVTLE